ncbi:OmpH family outer membrane protein [Cellulophaga baltica]|uniref:OmpH family outer membrane protein n=1 Tax=Cellulophaga TaxID=104264 RepID=UPI001C067717|nr:MULTISPECIES: OmpH family outer membrane protein [Cellulophaga]MBU2995152.1 OmpH family outer membrane protein [Cellulophaga baltica]MDO6766547.1 OmpH family outer membrane protein [Cellulophaga sp. 1_MG-2023]
MKTKVLLIISAVLVSVSAFSQVQRGTRIAYVDMEYILENVEEYGEANDQLAKKVQKWKLEIEQEKSAIDQMKKDLMAEKVLLTAELIEEREEEIKILEKEMFDYQQDRFGPQGDLIISKQRLIQPIQDQVFNEVQKIGQAKKYDLIFDRSADIVMLFAQNRLDISDLVLKAISRTRKVKAAKDRIKKRNKFDDVPEEEEMTEALKERIEQSKTAEETREKLAEEKRAEQLKLREERKKAYEARRKKLLEEREAKKKAAKEAEEESEEESDDSEEENKR